MDSDNQLLNERLAELQQQLEKIRNKPHDQRKDKFARKQRGRGGARLEGEEQGTVKTQQTQDGVQKMQSHCTRSDMPAQLNEQATDQGNGSRQTRWAVLSTAQNSDGQFGGFGRANNSKSQSKNKTMTSNKANKSHYLQTLDAAPPTPSGNKSAKLKLEKNRFTTM